MPPMLMALKAIRTSASTALISLIRSGIRPVARRTSLLLKVRLLHVSNNSLKGPDHNPDIQALGAQAGVAVRF